MSKPLCFSIFGLWLCALANAAEPSLHLINNQPFPIRMPVEVRGFSGSVQDKMAQGTHTQLAGSNVVFIAEVPASAQKEITFQTGKPSKLSSKWFHVERRPSPLAVSSKGDGVAMSYDGKPAGRLSWGVYMESLTKKAGETNSGKVDFAKAFSPMPMHFEKKGGGLVFETWRGTGRQSGLQVAVTIKSYHDGFMDVEAEVTNESAPTSHVYAAVICKWEHPPVTERTLCYDNRRQPFASVARTGFREEDARHWHMQHGIDWVRSALTDGPTVLWLNPFNPSFTVKVPASPSGKTAARYTGANQAQLDTEGQSVPGAFYAVTEIARSNTKSLRDRFRENVLPPQGEGFRYSSRFVFQNNSLTDDQADQSFLGYTGYQEQRETASGREISFGVKSVRFGTSYFPYSTLGENFDARKLPGMDRESFWPLAADTVRQWPLFADDIRRDLRMAKWMGFQSIRLHHLELLAPIEQPLRQEYLDFLFGQLRQLKLTALVDVYASPQQIEDLLKRYGDAIDGIEIENEVLIWSIPLDRPEYWKQVYEVVKKTAPHVRVHLTAQNNMGMFDKLSELGVGFDRVGLHAYVDSLEAIPSARGWALSAANYGSKVGKPPVITEWNWRSLTRMTPEERAAVYPQIIEGAIGARSIPEFYEFQFQETMSPNLRAGRGNILRHYEILNLSRHPKRDALELASLIEKYSAPDDPIRQLRAPYSETVLNADGTGKARLVLSNGTAQTRMKLTAVVETSTNLIVQLLSPATFEIGPGEARTVDVALKLAANAKPGFYHYFIQLRGPGDFLRYAAAEARFEGKPDLDLTSAIARYYPRSAAEELKFDFTKTAAVVYGTDAPVLEAETAIAIAQTLESATGRLVPFCQLDKLPESARASGNLILVGTAKTHALIAQQKDSHAETRRRGENKSETSINRIPAASGAEWLVITGANSEAVERAGMDLLLRYWGQAKDSAVRRVGIVEKVLPRGIDATKLP